MLRCVYLDLDGTLLGRGGSLLHDGDGGISLLGPRALEACLRADVEIVLMSGRRKETMIENARLVGATSYIYEAGSVLVFEGEEHWLTGSHRPGPVSVHDQIRDSGAPAMLLERYAGRLEYHEPWHVGRQVSHLMRGQVDVGEVDVLLAAEGHGDLRLVDNGVIARRSPGAEGLRPRPQLSPPAGGRVEGDGGGGAPGGAGTPPVRDDGGRRLAGGSRDGGIRRGVLAGGQRGREGPGPGRGDRRSTERAGGRGGARAGGL